jgi:hypothetical protein
LPGLSKIDISKEEDKKTEKPVKNPFGTVKVKLEYCYANNFIIS